MRTLWEVMDSFYSCPCADAAAGLVRRQTASKRRWSWSGQGDNESWGVPHDEEGYGADARGAVDQHSKWEQSVREQEHAAAGSWNWSFAKMPSKPRIRRHAWLAQLPPVWGGSEEANKCESATDASLGQAAERGAVQSEGLPCTHGVGV